MAGDVLFHQSPRKMHNKMGAHLESKIEKYRGEFGTIDEEDNL
jgi:hypothetical protein